MRFRLPTAVALLGLALAAPAASAATSQPGNGDFVLHYERAKKANKRVFDIVRRANSLQRVVDEVNQRIALPRDVIIVVTDVHDRRRQLFEGNPSRADIRELLEGGPLYAPVQKGVRQPFIQFTPAFLKQMYDGMRIQLRGVKGIGPGTATIAAADFVLAHEIGHALVDQLDLPVTGREEDSVDGFAAWLTVDNPNFGPLAALATAAFWDILAQMRGDVTLHDLMEDTHSTHEQRAAQFLCWIYGSDRKTFADLIGPDGLPRGRAGGCADEWKQVQKAWPKLLGGGLADWLKD